MTIKNTFAVAAPLLLAAFFAGPAGANTFTFSFDGPGVSGTVDLTYGTATDLKDSGGFEVTGISGTFTDTNNGLDIINASIGPLEPITHDTPDPTNLLAPNDFSRFAVATGLPAQSGGFLTFDNLYYPGGSPATASDYTIHGGLLDIYGLLFEINGGDVVNLWSNGDFTETGLGPIDYGVAVATSTTALDYVSGGVSVAPEPDALFLAAGGLLGLFVWRRRTTHEGTL